MYIRLVLDYLAISLPFGSYIKPPPPSCCFPIWSLGYGSCVPEVSFLFIEPSTPVPLQLVYVIRKKFLGKWNKFGWLRKKIVTFCNVFLSSSINTYQNKNWMLSLTLIIWALHINDLSLILWSSCSCLELITTPWKCNNKGFLPQSQDNLALLVTDS